MTWLSKTWEFGIWEESFDTHLQVLQTTPDAVRTLIAGISPEILQLQPEGKWSVNEHIGHLLTMESLWIARLDDFVLGHGTLRPWNGTNADTEAGSFNKQRTAKILEDFEDIRIPHVTMLGRLKVKSNAMISFHERLNTSMSLADHLMFVAQHDLHHLNTIRHIIQISA